MARPRKRDSSEVDELAARSLEYLTSLKTLRLMPRPRVPANWSVKDFADELRRCRRAWERENLAALVDALLYSGVRDERSRPRGGARGRPILAPEDELQIPRWVFDAALKIVCSTVPKHRADSKGRHAAWVRQYRQDIIDFFRWDAVEGLRGTYEASLDRCLALAVASLDGTLASGTEDQIRRSWRMVTRRGPNSGRYYLSRFVQPKPGPREL